jgi:hypothetical protein
MLCSAKYRITSRTPLDIKLDVYPRNMVQLVRSRCTGHRLISPSSCKGSNFFSIYTSHKQTRITPHNVWLNYGSSFLSSRNND